MSELKDIINSPRDLEIAIEALEERKKADETAIRSTAGDLAKNLHPAHLLFETVDEAITDPDLKNEFIDAVSDSTGFLAKKLIVRNKDNSTLELLGSIAQLSISTYIAQLLRK